MTLEDEIIYVTQGAVENAHPNQTLNSGGVGPCLVVGAVTPHLARMGHFIQPTQFDLDKVIESLDNPKLYFCGLQDEKPYHTQQRALRAHIENKYAHATFKWCPVGKIQEMRIKNQEVEIEYFRDPYY